MTKKIPTRQYTAKNMCDAPRRSGPQWRALAKQLGITPTQEFVVNGRTFRTYDQAAMDKLLTWRMQQDQVKEPVPEPAPITKQPDDVAGRIDQLQRISAEHREHTSRQLIALYAKLNELGDQLTQILDAITAPERQLGAAVTTAALGVPDDERGH